MSKKMIQNHSVLAMRYNAMARKFDRGQKLTDEEKATKKSLEEQADEHKRKAAILQRDTFIMIL